VASIDYGLRGHGAPHCGRADAGDENLTNLNQPPATGAFVFALPMKISGIGGPVRVVALIPKR
jgi:kynurenine formamidase